MSSEEVASQTSTNDGYACTSDLVANLEKLQIEQKELITKLVNMQDDEQFEVMQKKIDALEIKIHYVKKIIPSDYKHQVTTLYPTGELKERYFVRYFDSSKKKVGLYQSFFKHNQKVKLQCHYDDDGKLDGQFILYFPINDNIQKSCWYKHGQLHGVSKLFWSNEQVARQCTYTNGIMDDGSIKYWNQDGTVAYDDSSVSCIIC